LKLDPKSGPVMLAAVWHHATSNSPAITLSA
jgi:hypothetical protein